MEELAVQEWELPGFDELIVLVSHGPFFIYPYTHFGWSREDT